MTEHESAKATKPVAGTIPLTGEAARWFVEYLEKTVPDPKAQEAQMRADIERLANAFKHGYKGRKVN